MNVSLSGLRLTYSISYHIYCTHFSFKHVMLNFPEGVNQVFELN